MDRNEFNYLIKDMSKDSIKRACLIVREYLRYTKTEEIAQQQVLKSEEGCAVTLEEYLEATKLLLAYSYENSNENSIQKLYKCESDCSYNHGFNSFCKGEFSLSSTSCKLCMYYSDSQYI